MCKQYFITVMTMTRIFYLVYFQYTNYYHGVGIRRAAGILQRYFPKWECIMRLILFTFMELQGPNWSLIDSHNI